MPLPHGFSAIRKNFCQLYGCFCQTSAWQLSAVAWGSRTGVMWCLCREQFGTKHHRYSDALLDYGFFLLNIDCICQAVKVYQMALDIRVAVFGGNNLHVAIAHEDLAYCAYVHEYSSGKFHDARSVAVDATAFSFIAVSWDWKEHKSHG